MKPSIKPFDILRDIVWGIYSNKRFSKKKLLAAVEIADSISPVNSDNELIEKARDIYVSDEIEIDDCPLILRGGEDGTWVNAWVRVPEED